MAAALVGILVTLAAGAAQATNYTVDTLNDSSGASNCSLRDAINAANGHPNPNSSCGISGSGNDVISFSVTGEIKLTARLPAIDDAALTIVGP